MELRHKIVLLAVVPLVVSAAVMALVVQRQGAGLAESQMKEIDKRFAEDELKNLVWLARQAIPDLDSAERGDPQTRRRVLEQLRSLDFGAGGYFYVYELNGINLMHPWQPELEGKVQWELQDDQGRWIVRDLIATARSGGGFVRYRWPHPPASRRPGQPPAAAPAPPASLLWSEKLGYVVELPNWGWVLGTGVYLEDIEALRRSEDLTQDAKQQIRASSTAAVHRTLQWIALIALLAGLAVASLAVALNVSQQRLANARLRKLTRDTLALQEQERARVARFLHDDAGQDLGAVKWTLENVIRELEGAPSHAALLATLRQSLARLAEGLDRLRELSHELRPKLQGDRLAEHLAETAERFTQRTGLAVDVETGEIRPMSDEAATALFRVAQQALDNVARHARATRVAIRLAVCRRWRAWGTELVIRDDGCGFNVAAIERRLGGGIGLVTMRERIAEIGGRLMVRSGARGTAIEAFLPNTPVMEGDPHENSDDGNGDDGDEPG